MKEGLYMSNMQSRIPNFKKKGVTVSHIVIILCVMFLVGQSGSSLGSVPAHASTASSHELVGSEESDTVQTILGESSGCGTESADGMFCVSLQDDPTLLSFNSEQDALQNESCDLPDSGVADQQLVGGSSCEIASEANGEGGNGGSNDLSWEKIGDCGKTLITVGEWAVPEGGWAVITAKAQSIPTKIIHTVRYNIIWQNLDTGKTGRIGNPNKVIPVDGYDWVMIVKARTGKGKVRAELQLFHAFNLDGTACFGLRPHDTATIK